MGRISEAEVECDLARAVSQPADVVQAAHVVEGLIAEVGGNIAEAVHSYQQAASIFPLDAEPRYRAGRLLAQSNPLEARKWLRDAVDVNPESYFGELAAGELSKLPT